MPGGAQTKVAPHGLAPRGIPGCRASDQRPDERGGAGTAQGRGGWSRRPGAAGVPTAPAPRPRRPTTCSNRRLSELARIGLCSSFLTRTGLLSSVHPSLRFPVRPSVPPVLHLSVPAFIRAASAHSSVRQLFERRAPPTGRRGHRTNLTLALQGSRLCQQRLDERPQCANPRVPARGCVTRRALSSERGPGAYRARGSRLLPRLPFAPLCPSASLELVPTAGQAPRSPRVQGLEPVLHVLSTQEAGRSPGESFPTAPWA